MLAALAPPAAAVTARRSLAPPSRSGKAIQEVTTMRFSGNKSAFRHDITPQHKRFPTPASRRVDPALSCVACFPGIGGNRRDQLDFRPVTQLAAMARAAGEWRRAAGESTRRVEREEERALESRAAGQGSFVTNCVRRPRVCDGGNARGAGAEAGV